MRELLLQITAEEHLFAEACGGAETNPHHDLQRAARREKTDLLLRILQIAGVTHAHAERYQGDGKKSAQPDAAGDGQIEQEVTHVVPASADQLAQSSS